MEYVTHDEIIELMNLFAPFFLFLFAMSLVVLFNIIKIFIDNIFWLLDARAARLERIEAEQNGR